MKPKFHLNEVLFKLTLLLFAINTAGQNKKPNILFLMTDQHSMRVLGSYGNQIIKTPNLDKLANNGIIFKSNYCQNPICLPSRASLITGKMPSSLGIFGNDGVLREKTTMATVFSAQGYEVAWLGKEHWGATNAEVGFGNLNDKAHEAFKEKYRPLNKLRKDVGRLPQNAYAYKLSEGEDYEALVTDHAIKFLEDNTMNNFFLGVSFKKPHFPFMCHQKYFDLYKDIVDMPEVTPEMIEALSINEKKTIEKYELDKMSSTEIKQARAMYYGMVTYIDEQFGRILDKLKELGLRENTIIVYTSDHGEMAGEHGLWYKNSFLEASATAPLIFSYPRALPVNKKINASSMLLDIFPTLCELSDISQPNDLEGKSLLPLMNGDENTDNTNRVAYSEMYRSSTGIMVRKGKWKYIRYNSEKDYLYDIDMDPEERNNLINSTHHQEIISELSKLASAKFRKKYAVENSTENQFSVQFIANEGYKNDNLQKQKPNNGSWKVTGKNAFSVLHTEPGYLILNDDASYKKAVFQKGLPKANKKYIVGAKLKFNKSDGKLNKHSKIMSIGFTESNGGNNRLCIQIRRHKNGKQYQLSFWENTGTMKSFKNSMWVSEEELGLHDDNISDKLAITLEIQKASTASGWSAIAKLENLTTNQKLTNISIANFDTNQDYFLSPLYAVINTAEPVSSSKCSNIVIDELFIKS